MLLILLILPRQCCWVALRPAGALEAH